jgi:hypothetical protein
VGRWTVHLLRRLDPAQRLHVAAWLFWLSILGGVLSTLLLAHSGYERVLMGISWGAITITTVDVVLTADVRDETS